MPITVSWDNDEHTVALWTLEGSWDWPTFRQAQIEFHELLRSVEHMVDVIADMRTAHVLPADAFMNFRMAEKNALPNRRYIVLVGTNTFIRAMATTFNRIFRRNKPPLFLVADSLDEARQILAGMRTT